MDDRGKGERVCFLAAISAKHGIIAPPGELPSWYTEKYKHSRGGVMAFVGKSTGEYHLNMSGDVFTDWLEVVLFPALEEMGISGAIVVLDNAPYHVYRSDARFK